MFKKVLIIFTTFFTFSYADNIFEIEKRREEQNKFDSIINEISQNTKPQNTDIENDYILDITNISIFGNTILEAFQINPILRKYIGKNKNISKLINELENKYMDKGYITTRVKVDLEKSDFSVGNISLFIYEGKINKIYFDGNENTTKSYITFPQRKNQILNIRDLDQGIENLGDSSTMDISPADKNGYSNINIKRGKASILSGGINYNDLGLEETGRHRYKVFLNSHNLFGLNENMNFSFQEKIQRQIKDGDNKNYSIGINIPYKYYSFSYSYEHSKYLRTIPALGRKYYATGNTTNQSFALRRVFHRNENHKIDLGVNLALKDIKNYIDEVKLTTGSRKLSVLTLDSSYIGRVGLGLLSTNISTSFGLKKFGANIDTNEWYREENSPKAQFRKYNFNISWYRPIDKFYYKVNLGGQYSKDILYSQEKLGIGDDTTVRGFKEESLQGDKGFYIRNEIGYKGLNLIEPYIAYDYGYVKNNKIIENHQRQLQGITLGTKINIENLEGSIAVSKAIDRPSYFRENSVVVYISLTYKF